MLAILRTISLACLIIFVASCKTNSMLRTELRGSYVTKTHYKNGLPLPYNILYPEKNKSKYPLLLFLHGAGERGNDNKKQLVHGSEWLSTNNVHHPAVVVFPQCPTNDFWAAVDVQTDGEGHRKFYFGDKAPTPVMNQLLSLIDSMSALPYIDASRIYVMGLSMGGMATFELMWRRPGLFAAAAPICGGGNSQKSKSIAETPCIHVFHGAIDEVVIPDHSRQMVEAIKPYNKNILYTEYQNVNHNSWDNVFKEKKFFEWMFGCKLN